MHRGGRGCLAGRAALAFLSQLMTVVGETPKVKGERDRTREGSRVDLWVLLFILGITLLAAGYTLLTALWGG